MSKETIYGVALGPGDPELITIKALKTLQRADVIYYPVTTNSKGIKSSMAMRVLGELELDGTKLKPVSVAMKYDRSEVNATYRQLAARCIQHAEAGEVVAVVSEGDIAFYSTFAYLIDDFNNAGINYEMIPGVPAFILGGSLSRQAICTQSDKVLVVPDLSSEAQLIEHVLSNETVVMMKVSKVKGWIADFIAANQLDFFYGEYMGTDKAFTCSDIEVLKQRQIPYFSIIIIKSTIVSNGSN
ncbi:precorrin-2 C(20)-methyltransferase [Carboxylicivirga sp. RSCT41]|uniref:precorrin-2 C(20)-methyltransferase n=1 Tax=Carboxylicivirga agarovorans TaxID=3417570 RepID=UPI003D350837